MKHEQNIGLQSAMASYIEGLCLPLGVKSPFFQGRHN